MQRMIDPPEPLRACRAAGHRARLIHDQRRASAGGGYFVECACARTDRFPTTEGAVMVWQLAQGMARGARNVLHLPATPRRARQC